MKDTLFTDEEILQRIEEAECQVEDSQEDFWILISPVLIWIPKFDPMMVIATALDVKVEDVLFALSVELLNCSKYLLWDIIIGKDLETTTLALTERNIE